jgi:hypothetical protein
MDTHRIRMIFFLFELRGEFAAGWRAHGSASTPPTHTQYNVTLSLDMIQKLENVAEFSCHHRPACIYKPILLISTMGVWFILVCRTYSSCFLCGSPALGICVGASVQI